MRLAREIDELSSAVLRASVERARGAGRTWQQIGDILEVSRQAAFQRFGHPVDPRTGEPMSSSTLPGAARRDTELLIDWLEERYDAVAADFNEVMTEKLPPDQLAPVWAQLIGTVGAYQQMGEPVVTQRGDLTVVDVPMTFEAAEMKVRVAYDRDGKIGGLFVLPANAL